MAIVYMHHIIAVLPAVDKLIVMKRAAGQIQNVHPGGLGYGIGGITGNILNLYAALLTKLHINIVYAGPGFTDQFEFWSGIKESLVYNYLIKARYICVPDSFTGLLGG